jgi:hypothetical protein
MEGVPKVEKRSHRGLRALREFLDRITGYSGH